MGNNSKQIEFYEEFWADHKYQEKYAFDVAVRDRFPAIRIAWSSLDAPNDVLDYGCGNGVLTYWLKCNGFGKNITGVDISKTGIDNAKRSFSKKGLSFKTLDDFWKLKNKNYDVIISSHVFEHISKPEIALEEIKNLSEWFLIEVPLENAIWPNIVSKFRRAKRNNNPLGHVNFWSKKSFNSFLIKNNLININDFQYASAPFSKYNNWLKRCIERAILIILGVRVYGFFMSTHYIVLARKCNED